MGADVAKPEDPIRQKALDRLERIRKGIDAGTQALEDIDGAIAMRDWKTLGYDSLEDYFYLTGIAQRWRQQREPQQQLVRTLVEHVGLSQTKAAELMDLSQQRVSQLLRGSSGHETRKVTSQASKPQVSGSPALTNGKQEPPVLSGVVVKDEPAVDPFAERQDRPGAPEPAQGHQDTAQEPAEPQSTATAPRTGIERPACPQCAKLQDVVSDPARLTAYIAKLQEQLVSLEQEKKS